jgi:putative membrane protein
MTGMTGPMWAPTSLPDLRHLIAWHPQPIPVFPILCAVLLLGYLVAIWRLLQRGIGWPIGRTVSWVLGLISVLAVTGTAVGGYGMELFSVHMLQHMVLSMLSPILLLMGRPVTLTLRALPSRGRGGSWRRLLLAGLHSRVAAVLTSPLLTIPLFILSLYGLYFTRLFDAAMSNWFGHTWMLLHFLAIGSLVFWPLLGLDPSPHISSPGSRILQLFITTPFHAFFGVIIMGSPVLIATYFAHPPAGWHTSALQDQDVAGGIAWGFSEIPTLIVLLAIAVQWWRISTREARRHDRSEERTGDLELKAYNAWLAEVAEHRTRTSR